MKNIDKKYVFALTKKFLAHVLLLLIFALILTWFLEFRCSNDFGKTWEFVFKNSGRIFLFNSFIMFLILMFVYSIVLRPWLAIGFVGILTTIIAYVNENKLAARMTPLLPEDFELATEVSSLTKFVNVGGLILLIVGIIGIIIAAKVLALVTKRIFSLPSYLTIKKDGSKKHFILIRVIFFILTITVFLSSTNFIINNKGVKYQYVDFLDTTFTAWNQERNYRENGFLIGFLYNCGKFEVKKPPEYSKKYLGAISDEYKKVEGKDNERQSLKDSEYNIVIILNESFYDPEILSNYYQYSGGDITPNLHKIMNKYPSGQMYSLDYGGGTANIEFEALTGFTNYYTNTVPYTNLIPKSGEIPSAATWAKKNGYDTTAIHTYYGGMYKRNISLANEGFDKFITSLEIDDFETEPGSEYHNDKTAYNEVLKVLRGSDSKQMVALITMQNHTPFSDELYDGKRDFKLTGNTENYDEEDAKKIETYFQLLYNSDKYLGDFLEELDDSDEKTVVLFFGDHSPGVFAKVVEEDINLSRLTPYFIYSNFDMDLGNKELPTTTPNCLVNTLYNRLNVEKPTMAYLLDEVCKKYPILTAAYFGDAGLMQADILNKYENVTYDVLSGKKYWLDLANW